MSKNGRPVTTVLSSNSTLMWRVFFPIFIGVFLLGLNAAFWLTDEDDLYVSLMPLMMWRLFLLFLLLGWVFLVWRTVWKLFRVDTDEAFLYVTNYWVTARYPWEDVENVEEFRRLGKRMIRLTLKGSGRFGNKIVFLPGTTFDTWLANRTAAMEALKLPKTN